MATDPNAAVYDWPVPAGTPAREVWYGLAGPADGSAAFWYRYTLLSTERGRQEARLWAAVTDTDGDSVFRSEAVTLDEAALDDDPFRYTLPAGELRSDGARGRLGDVSWDLSYDSDEYAFTPLRSQRLTDVLYRFAGTGKHWSRNEAVHVDGEVAVGDRTLSLDGAPGHQGHTLGASPPERWTWLQCNGFDDPSVAVECLNLDGTVSMCLRRDGEVHALNRVRDVVGPVASETDHVEPGRWSFSGSGEGVDLSVEVVADTDHWQRVAYMTPDDTPRYNAHCSVSEVTLTYSVDGEERTLTSDAGRAEWVDSTKPVAGEYRPTWD
ncbi:tocopherol cyclase family protein [Halorarius halobius]|uniref:tocopherol cyclase family protein n=1 Tax=Halorarius halobius TaxID=2962671 RepID=UPI0020CE752E|nr:tocopherol cyclase family protein [Halorarius halobius]